MRIGRDISQRLAILAMLSQITACTSPEVTQQPTGETAAFASAEPPSTETSEPTATSVVPTTAPNPTLAPTPDFLQLPISEDVLFTSANDPACQLPCWQDLRIGISTRSDVQRMFDHVFAFQQTKDFFDSAPAYDDSWTVESPDIFTTGYSWVYGPERTYGILMLVAVDKVKGFLEGIRFQISPGDILSVHLPVEVISELGQPHSVITKIVYNAPNNSDSVPIIRLGMLYDAGLSISYVYFPERDDISGDFNEFCLSQIPAFATYTISEPINSNSPTPLQREWIFDYIEGFDLQPMEDYLGLSVSEFTEIAMSDDPCLDLDYTTFSP